MCRLLCFLRAVILPPNKNSTGMNKDMKSFIGRFRFAAEKFPRRFLIVVVLTTQYSVSAVISEKKAEAAGSELKYRSNAFRFNREFPQISNHFFNQ